MTPDTRQVVQLAKQGLTPDEIAGALGLAVEQVVAMVISDKEAVKELSKAAKEPETPSSVSTSISALREKALSVASQLLDSDNDKVRANMVTYVLDHELGLKKPKQEVNVTLNVGSINDILERVANRRKSIEAKITDVRAEVLA